MALDVEVDVEVAPTFLPSLSFVRGLYFLHKQQLREAALLLCLYLPCFLYHPASSLISCKMRRAPSNQSDPKYSIVK